MWKDIGLINYDMFYCAFFRMELTFAPLHEEDEDPVQFILCCLAIDDLR